MTQEQIAIVVMDYETAEDKEQRHAGNADEGYAIDVRPLELGDPAEGVAVKNHECCKKTQSGKSGNLRSRMRGWRRGDGCLLRRDLSSRGVDQR